MQAELPHLLYNRDILKTFQSKDGKEHWGYASKLEKSVGENGSVVTDYQYKQSNHGDSQFIQEHLKQMDKQGDWMVIISNAHRAGQKTYSLQRRKMWN